MRTSSRGQAAELCQLERVRTAVSAVSASGERVSRLTAWHAASVPAIPSARMKSRRSSPVNGPIPRSIAPVIGSGYLRARAESALTAAFDSFGETAAGTAATTASTSLAVA